MTGFPDNPFEPGAGTMPPHAGGRPEIEDVLSGILGRLRAGRRNSYLAFLYGPHGNGKTVLLRWLEDEAVKQGAPNDRQIAHARISRSEMVSPVSVADTILRVAASPLNRVIQDASATVPGLGSIQVTDEERPRALSLAQALSKSLDPFLITLDDADEVPPEALGELLDLVQGVGRHRPIAVALAGTPGLEAALRASRASFWSRGERLRVGLLGETGAREALARPFRDAGLEAADRAVAELAAAAENYPYFLQLYGRAAWRVVEASGGRTFLPDHVAPALAAGERARQDYYLDRYKEFGDAGLLPVARWVADAFVFSAETPADRRMTNAAFNKHLAHEDGYVHKEFLFARGFVWQDGSADHSWTPGLPSLMDYILEYTSDR